jgi:DNA-directed RNA polymerase specialized sigma24 family protein
VDPDQQRAPARPAASRGRDRSDRLGFDAFVLLYRGDYLHYAQARLGDPGESSKAVDEALRRTERFWGLVLSGPQPAACAWHILRTTVTASCVAPPESDTDCLHQGLPAAQADAVLLLHRLGMPTAKAAALMGVEPPIVQADLLMAQRLLRHRPL